MTSADLERAREWLKKAHCPGANPDSLAASYAEVRAEQREKDAKVCDRRADSYERNLGGDVGMHLVKTARHCAVAVRDGELGVTISEPDLDAVPETIGAARMTGSEGREIIERQAAEIAEQEEVLVAAADTDEHNQKRIEVLEGQVDRIVSGRQHDRAQIAALEELVDQLDGMRDPGRTSLALIDARAAWERLRAEELS